VKAGEATGQGWMSESEMILVKFPSGFKAAASPMSKRAPARSQALAFTARILKAKVSTKLVQIS